MKLHVRTRPEDPPLTGIVVNGPGGKSVLLIGGERFPVHDRRLREMEVLSATDQERHLLKQHGYRIHRL